MTKLQLKRALPVLQATLELFSVKSNWTRGKWATQKRGGGITYCNYYDIHDPRTDNCKFCLDGGLMKCAPTWKAFSEARQFLADDVVEGSIIAFNDSRKTSFEDIRAVLRKGIRMAKRQLAA